MAPPRTGPGGGRRPARGGSRSLAARGVAHLRLVHPFPSALDGLVTAALVLLAGGPSAIALRLGLAMFAIQAGIGALNDCLDSPADALAKPAKPIPSGAVRPAVGRAIAVGGLGAGLGLSVPSGPAVVTVAFAGAGVGVLYDAWLKGGPWSWLGFALGLPLLPVYAWLGATGGLPGPFAILAPAAVAAGAALALGNALVDVDRDRAAGVASVAVALGRATTWRLGVGLFALVAGAAAGSLLWFDAAHGRGLVVVGAGLVAIAAGLAAGREADPARRERGWELQAIGTGLLAVGWVGALLDAGRL